MDYRCALIRGAPVALTLLDTDQLLPFGVTKVKRILSRHRIPVLTLESGKSLANWAFNAKIKAILWGATARIAFEV